MSDPYSRQAFDKSPEAVGGPMYFDSSSVSARSILESARYAELDRKQSFYECTQHDTKAYDFEGRVLSQAGGYSATQPLLSNAVAPFYVPLSQRRPSSPYRLARAIVHAFTDMVFGQQRFPSVTVQDDVETQAFLNAIIKASKLPAKMLRARNIGGACGSVGISWCFVDGMPRIEVHNPKRCWVHAWKDREQLIPSHVTEVFLLEKDVFDPATRAYVRQWVWCRRDWTEQADLVYQEVPFERKAEPTWVIDAERSVPHGEGSCHFVWVQNTVSDEVDGDPDYHGQYEMFDAVDLTFSTITRGTTLNLDPTLILRMDPEMIARSGVRKGSDNALTVGETGDAHYMEMSGSGINAGIAVLKEQRKLTLEAVQCVIPEPEQIAAAGTSSVALKMAYAPMLARCDEFRETYGDGVLRLLKAMLDAARRYTDASLAQGVLPRFDLPHRQETRPVLDAVGEPTGELETVYLPQTPGAGKDIELVWGPYFTLTEQDKQASVSTMQTANGMRPLISQQSAVEAFAALLGKDPSQEWNRLQDEAAKASNAVSSGLLGDSYAAMGGKVDSLDGLPPGAV